MFSCALAGTNTFNEPCCSRCAKKVPVIGQGPNLDSPGQGKSYFFSKVSESINF